MIHNQNKKIVPVIYPQAIKDNALFVGAHGSTPVDVDCAGWDWADVYIMLGATDVAVAAMNIQHSDDTTAGNYAVITGYDWINTSGLAEPTASDSNCVFHAGLDLRTIKRYLNVELTAGNGTSGTYAVCWVELSRGNEAPTTDAERGIGVDEAGNASQGTASVSPPL